MGILCDMNLSEITILIGGLAIAMAGVGLARADLLRGVIRGVSEKSACWVGVGGALLLVRRSRSLADEYGAQWVQAFHLCIGTLGVYWQCDVSERVAGGSGIGWVALFNSGSNHEGSGFFRSPVFPNYFCVGI